MSENIIKNLSILNNLNISLTQNSRQNQKTQGKSFSEFLKSIESSQKDIKHPFREIKKTKNEFKSDLVQDQAGLKVDSLKNPDQTEAELKVDLTQTGENADIEFIMQFLGIPEDIAVILNSLLNTASDKEDSTLIQSIKVLPQKIDEFIADESDFNVSGKFLYDVKLLTEEFMKPDENKQPDKFESFIKSLNDSVFKNFNLLKSNLESMKQGINDSSENSQQIKNLIDIIDGKDIKLESFRVSEEQPKTKNSLQQILAAMQKPVAVNITGIKNNEPVVINSIKTESEPQILILESETDKTDIIKSEKPQDKKIPEIMQNTSSMQSISAEDVKINTVEIQSHINDVSEKITQMIMQNKTGRGFELKIRLTPENLGEMIVKITLSKGDVNLNIMTDNKLAQKEILNQQNTLRNVLESHEMNLTGFDISGGNGNEHKNMFEDYKQQEKNNENKRFIFGLSRNEQNVERTEYSREKVELLKNYIKKSRYYKTV